MVVASWEVEEAVRVLLKVDKPATDILLSKVVAPATLRVSPMYWDLVVVALLVTDREFRVAVSAMVRSFSM